MRCDRILEREKRQNYDCIKGAVLAKIATIKTGLPRLQVDFTENPAWWFDVRNPLLCGATVTVTMSQDGAALFIEVQRNRNPDAVARSTVRVVVKGDDTCFEYNGRMVTPLEAADIILLPVLE